MRLAVSFCEVDTEIAASFVQSNCFFNEGFNEAVYTKTNMGELIENLTITASVDNQVGTPDVTVEKSVIDNHVNFDLGFSCLRGNGITGVQLISTVGLEKTYRITTDSGDYYDMVLNDGNGIASTEFNEGSITFTFTDGTTYTTPSLIPYVVDSIIDDTADSGEHVTWSVTKIQQVIAHAANVLYNTTEYWNSQIGYISARNVMYVYLDAREYQEQDIPRLKIGDGTTYLVDLPFLNEEEIDHINNQIIHITAAERASWNNKVTTYEPQGEILQITKD